MGTQQLSTRSPFNLPLSPFYLGQFSCLSSRGPCVILPCQIRYNFRVKLCLPDVPGSFGRKFVSGLMNDGASGQRMSQFGGGSEGCCWHVADHERPRIPFPFPLFLSFLLPHSRSFGYALMRREGESHEYWGQKAINSDSSSWRQGWKESVTFVSPPSEQKPSASAATLRSSPSCIMTTRARELLNFPPLSQKDLAQI